MDEESKNNSALNVISLAEAFGAGDLARDREGVLGVSGIVLLRRFLAGDGGTGDEYKFPPSSSLDIVSFIEGLRCSFVFLGTTLLTLGLVGEEQGTLNRRPPFALGVAGDPFPFLGLGESIERFISTDSSHNVDSLLLALGEEQGRPRGRPFGFGVGGLGDSRLFVALGDENKE